MLAKIGIGEESENYNLEISELKILIEMLSKAASELKYAVLPQIPLELAIVEWSVARQPRVSDDARLQNPQNQPSNPKPNFSSSESGLPRSDKDLNQNITQQDIAKYSENDALWIALIDKVKAYNHSIAGVLRGCSIKSYDGKSLIIEAKFKFHRDKLSEKKTQEIVIEACKNITKKNVKVEVLLKPA